MCVVPLYILCGVLWGSEGECSGGGCSGTCVEYSGGEGSSVGEYIGGSIIVGGGGGVQWGGGYSWDLGVYSGRCTVRGVRGGEGGADLPS